LLGPSDKAVESDLVELDEGGPNALHLVECHPHSGGDDAQVNPGNRIAILVGACEI